MPGALSKMCALEGGGFFLKSLLSLSLAELEIFKIEEWGIFAKCLEIYDFYCKCLVCARTENIMVQLLNVPRSAKQMKQEEKKPLITQMSLARMHL